MNPTPSAQRAAKKQAAASPSDVDMDSNDEHFSLEMYCVGVDEIPPKLWLPYSPPPLHRKSLLEIGLSASDVRKEHPGSLVELKRAFCQHFNVERAATGNRTPAAVYGKAKHVMSKFISTWTTEPAAENAIKAKGIDGPPQPVGEIASWVLYSIHTDKLKNTGTLVFDATELRQLLLDRDLLEERELSEREAQGVFLIWSEIKSQVLADEREVTKDRLWELGLKLEELEAIKKGIRLGALQVLKTEHGVVDLFDFQETTLASPKGKEVSRAARGTRDRNAQSIPVPGPNNTKDTGTQTGEVDNSEHDRGEGDWNVLEILAHRPPESPSRIETKIYLIEWAGEFKMDHEKYDWRAKDKVSEDLIDLYWRRREKIEAASKIGNENAAAAAAATKEDEEKTASKAKKKKGNQRGKKKQGKR
jgi:hypothetical protein